MNKMTKTVALIALSVLMLMCLCACAKKDGDSNGDSNGDSIGDSIGDTVSDSVKKGDALEGTWYFQSPDYGDVTATFDGNGKMTWGYDCSGIVYNDKGTYQHQDGEKITLKLDGWSAEQVATYTLDGNTLTITSDLGGMNGTYTKK